jgi:hypothetical protein
MRKKRDVLGILCNRHEEICSVMEELGHRYHGQVYRAMSKNGNLCVCAKVLFSKFQPALMENAVRGKVHTAAAARKSVEYWNKASYCQTWRK